jgi:hypothetical protein
MTIGQTTVKIATMIDHALRRAGIPTPSQTPETIDTARNNLYFILMNYTNRGMIFWGMEEEFLVLKQNKVVYDTPAGTVDVLNMNYRQITELDGDIEEDTNYCTLSMEEVGNLQMMFVESTFVGDLSIRRSNDGTTWETIRTVSHEGSAAWYTVDGVVPSLHYQLYHASENILLTDIKFVSGYVDRAMSRLNRDDYLALPNRQVSGTPLQYWFDRQLEPTISLWYAPSESSSVNTVQYFRQRQIADVGSLTDTLEIPPRWLEATIWQLAQNMAIEVPGVDPSRIQMCSAMAQRAIVEAEYDEQDNSPVSIVPNIGVYTS